MKFVIASFIFASAVFVEFGSTSPVPSPTSGSEIQKPQDASPPVNGQDQNQSQVITKPLTNGLSKPVPNSPTDAEVKQAQDKPADVKEENLENASSPVHGKGQSQPQNGSKTTSTEQPEKASTPSAGAVAQKAQDGQSQAESQVKTKPLANDLLAYSAFDGFGLTKRTCAKATDFHSFPQGIITQPASYA